MEEDFPPFYSIQCDIGVKKEQRNTVLLSFHRTLVSYLYQFLFNKFFLLIFVCKVYQV